MEGGSVTYLYCALVGAAIYQLVADARKHPRPRTDEELDYEEIQRLARETASRIVRDYEENT
jgi:hypothetical protein